MKFDLFGIPHHGGILREVDPKTAQAKIAKLKPLHDNDNEIKKPEAGANP